LCKEEKNKKKEQKNRKEGNKGKGGEEEGEVLPYLLTCCIFVSNLGDNACV
jgi:hypothetical protein